MLGDELGRDALVDEALGVAVARCRASGEPPVRDEPSGTRLIDSTPRGDDDVVRARHDALRREVRRLLARAALAVDRRGRHRRVEAGGEHGLARDVHGLVADLADAAHEHVVDLRDSSPLRASTDAQDARGEVDRMDAAQRAPGLAPPGRGADDVDDDGA